MFLLLIYFAISNNHSIYFSVFSLLDQICVFFYKGITPNAAKKLRSCYEYSRSVKAARGIVVVEKAIPEEVKSFMEEEFNADILISYRFEFFQVSSPFTFDFFFFVLFFNLQWQPQ